MALLDDFREINCTECATGGDLGFDFSMAFQPIVDIKRHEIFAQEALVRGLNNEPAAEIFRYVNDDNLYRFDQSCRVKAIKLAAELGIETNISINFMPRAVYRPELCIRTTLAAAKEYGFPVERIIFECTEGEQVDDHSHLRNIVTHYKQQGFMTAIDDFGAGFSGLNLLSEFQTDFIKIDMAMIRNIDRDSVRQVIVRGISQICQALSIRVIAEGIETREELETLAAFDIELFQGYYFARPAFENQAVVDPGQYNL